MEEEDWYLTGETDPFIIDSSEEAMVVCPVEERDERDDLPPRDARVESMDVFIEDRLEMVLTDERGGTPVSVTAVDPKAVLKGRVELYMLTVVFGDVGVVIVADDLSGTEPVASE